MKEKLTCYLIAEPFARSQATICFRTPSGETHEHVLSIEDAAQFQIGEDYVYHGTAKAAPEVQR